MPQGFLSHREAVQEGDIWDSFPGGCALRAYLHLFDDRYGVGAMGIPRGANYLFVCLSREGKLGWLQAIP